jgi:hypothetical protein
MMLNINGTERREWIQPMTCDGDEIRQSGLSSSGGGGSAQGDEIKSLTKPPPSCSMQATVRIT